MKQDNIVLVGFMGTGKSTVGKLLAQKLGFAFVDTDAQIVKEQGRTIADIFAEQGEAHFRTLETEMIRTVLLNAGQVVATGGGAVLAAENRDVMLEQGFVVALKADQAEIVARVRKDKGRPLLQGGVEARVATLLEKRRFAYDFADWIVETTGLAPEEVAERILFTFRERS